MAAKPKVRLKWREPNRFYLSQFVATGGPWKLFRKTFLFAAVIFGIFLAVELYRGPARRLPLWVPILALVGVTFPTLLMPLHVSTVWLTDEGIGRTTFDGHVATTRLWRWPGIGFCHLSPRTVRGRAWRGIWIYLADRETIATILMVPDDLDEAKIREGLAAEGCEIRGWWTPP